MEKLLNLGKSMELSSNCVVNQVIESETIGKKTELTSGKGADIKRKMKKYLFCFITIMTIIVMGCNKDKDKEGKVSSVTLNPNTLTLIVDKTATLTAIITPDNAKNKNVTWISSNPDIATVTNGIVSAISEGTATITVTTEDGNKTANCNVTVIDTTPKSMKIRLMFNSEPIEIELAGKGTVSIDWGDKQGAETYTLSATPSSHKRQNPGYTITITGDNVSYLSCSYSGIQDIEVDKNSKLTELKIYSLNLRDLNLSNNTKLIKLNYVGCRYLNGLNLSKNTALKELHCNSSWYPSYDNDETWNALYESLHSNAIQGGKTIYCSGRGDISIAEKKGWKVE